MREAPLLATLAGLLHNRASTQRPYHAERAAILDDIADDIDATIAQHQGAPAAVDIESRAREIVTVRQWSGSPDRDRWSVWFHSVEMPGTDCPTPECAETVASIERIRLVAAWRGPGIAQHQAPTPAPPVARNLAAAPGGDGRPTASEWDTNGRGRWVRAIQRPLDVVNVSDDGKWSVYKGNHLNQHVHGGRAMGARSAMEAADKWIREHADDLPWQLPGDAPTPAREPSPPVDLWFRCEEPMGRDGQGALEVCGTEGRMSALVQGKGGVLCCPDCGSSAIVENLPEPEDEARPVDEQAPKAEGGDLLDQLTAIDEEVRPTCCQLARAKIGRNGGQWVMKVHDGDVSAPKHGFWTRPIVGCPFCGVRLDAPTKEIAPAPTHAIDADAAHVTIGDVVAAAWAGLYLLAERGVIATPIPLQGEFNAAVRAKIAESARIAAPAPTPLPVGNCGACGKPYPTLSDLRFHGFSGGAGLCWARSPECLAAYRRAAGFPAPTLAAPRPDGETFTRGYVVDAIGRCAAAVRAVRDHQYPDGWPPAWNDAVAAILAERDRILAERLAPARAFVPLSIPPVHEGTCVNCGAAGKVQTGEYGALCVDVKACNGRILNGARGEATAPRTAPAAEPETWSDEDAFSNNVNAARTRMGAVINAWNRGEIGYGQAMDRSLAIVDGLATKFRARRAAQPAAPPTAAEVVTWGGVPVAVATDLDAAPPTAPETQIHDAMWRAASELRAIAAYARGEGRTLFADGIVEVADRLTEARGLVSGIIRERNALRLDAAAPTATTGRPRAPIVYHPDATTSSAMANAVRLARAPASPRTIASVLAQLTAEQERRAGYEDSFNIGVREGLGIARQLLDEIPCTAPTTAPAGEVTDAEVRDVVSILRHLPRSLGENGTEAAGTVERLAADLAREQDRRERADLEAHNARADLARVTEERDRLTRDMTGERERRRRIVQNIAGAIGEIEPGETLEQAVKRVRDERDAPATASGDALRTTLSKVLAALKMWSSGDAMGRADVWSITKPAIEAGEAALATSPVEARVEVGAVPREVAQDGVSLIATERQRQVTAEGWTPEHDDEHTQGELAMAAVSYAIHGNRGDGDPWHPPSAWPWDEKWWRPTPNNRVRELVKAGALIAAEIDRLQRAKADAAPIEGDR